MKKIQFYFLDTKTSLTERKKLKRYIEHLFLQENKVLENLSYIFCSDEYLLTINKDFLKHDYYTDIITFDLSETLKQVVGEIYISINRVKENAKTESVTFKEELHRVIFHGALHLCGYVDKKKKEKLNMRSKEDYYLKMYFK